MLIARLRLGASHSKVVEVEIPDQGVVAVGEEGKSSEHWSWSQTKGPQSHRLRASLLKALLFRPSREGNPSSV
jgi:hypothetical protein